MSIFAELSVGLNRATPVGDAAVVSTGIDIIRPPCDRSAIRLQGDPWLDAAPTNRLVDEGDPRRSSRALFVIVATSA